MKKIAILILFFLLLCSCEKKDVKEINHEDEVIENKVIKKINDDKDYAYLIDYKNFVLDNGNEYGLKLLEINLNSDDAKNINLEIKSFVNNSYKKFQYVNDMISSGNIIDYVYFINNEIISVIIKNNYYVNKMYVVDKDTVYNIDIKTGENIENIDLLKKYELTEDSLYEYVRGHAVSDDIEFTIMNIKQEGYNIYVNDSSNLVMIYYEVFNDEIIRKELIVEN